MNQIEHLENDKNRVKLTVTVGPDRFEEGLQHSYNKNKSKIFISGFRKGKAPRKIIEMQYGKNVFYEDAADFVIPDAYRDAIRELDVKPVSPPDNLDIIEISSEKGMVFTLEVTVRPEAVTENYRGLTYRKPSTTVTDEDIDRVLERDREKNARLISVERPVQEGDSVLIDFEGFIDGEAFEGGKGSDHELVIGSHHFIDTFEDQLKEHSIGDDVEVIVTFPENYDPKELAGKEALFKVEIKDVRVKELPEINDDFAQDTSEFDTLEELRADIGAKIADDKEQRAKSEIDNQLLDQLIDKTTVDVPDIMYENETNEMIRSFNQQLAYQGLSLDAYARHMGVSTQMFREMYAEEAKKRVNGDLALEAIARVEGLAVTDEEVKSEISNMAEQYKMDPKKFAETFTEDHKENIRDTMLLQKALQFVRDNAIEDTTIDTENRLNDEIIDVEES